MKNIYKIILTVTILNFLSSGIYAQTGINTQTPTSVLDVNGTTHIQGELLTGGNDATPGSAGEAGQFLVSQGEGLPPAWKTITVAEPEKGDYILFGTISRSDTQGGLKFINSEKTGGVSYPLDKWIRKGKNAPSDSWLAVSDVWKEFADFALELPAFEYSVRLVITLQMTIQGSWADGTIFTADNPGWESYAVGIFKDGGKPSSGATNGMYSYLKATRTGGCRGIQNPTDLFTMIFTLDDIPAGEATIYRIAATFREAASGIPTNSYLVFGRDLDNATVDQSDLKKATMKVDIFQKVR